MSTSLKARIVGLGSYLPERVLTNAELEAMVDTSDEWITTRTGIRERRIADKEEHASDMGIKAAVKAIDNAGVAVSDIEMIVVATMSPDYPSPATAALVQAGLKAGNAAAVDVQAACSGFLYGLSMVKAYVEAGIYRTVLLVATEKMSSIINYSDRNTCVIFGDGAAACVVTAEGSGLAIQNVCLGADGTLADLVIVPGGGSRHSFHAENIDRKLYYFHMNGKETFRHAVRRMGQSAIESMNKASVSLENLSWVVPHQANLRIIEAFAKQFNYPLERVYMTIQKYGNTSASSVAIALTELVESGQVHSGANLLLVAFGGGLSWGASLLTAVPAHTLSESETDTEKRRPIRPSLFEHGHAS